MVLFVEDATLHAGDLFTNRVYPSIDLKAGGTVREWGDTLDAVLALPFNHVIPGHGALSDRAGVEQFQRFMRQLCGCWRGCEGEEDCPWPIRSARRI